MADMIAIFGLLFITALAFPALLTAVWLALPGAVSRAHQRIERTPKRCLLMGIFTLGVIGLPVLILLSSAVAPLQAMGFLVLLSVLGVSTIGAAGIGMRFSDRLQERSRREMSALGKFLSGVVALELAAAFPIIGWATVLPIALLVSLGATTFALLRWRPRERAESHAPLPVTAVPQ